jgi:hypothetical protein
MTNIPKLQDIINGLISSFNAIFSISIPATGKSFLRDFITAIAGSRKTEYLYLADVQKNVWYDTATPRANGGKLEDFGEAFLNREPYPATQGIYQVKMTGTTGGTLATNTTFTSDPTSLNPGYLFITDAPESVSTGGVIFFLIRCTTAGTAALLAVGDTMTANIPLVGIQQQLLVTSVYISPIDAETIEEYRTAIGLQVRLAPQGGSVADYILWGSAVAGVRKIYPYSVGGSPYQVNVYAEAILSDSGGSFPDYNYGIPTPTILDNVTAAILNDPITGDARKPLGVVFGPGNTGAIDVTVFQVTITFTGSASISSADRLTIIAALRQKISNIRPFIAGADAIADQNDTLSTYLPAVGGAVTPPEEYVITVIAMQAVPGCVFTGVTMTIAGTPYTTYTFDIGCIPYLISANVTFS